MEFERASFFRVILRVSVNQSAIIKSKSTGKQETHGHKSSEEVALNNVEETLRSK